MDRPPNPPPLNPLQVALLYGLLANCGLLLLTSPVWVRLLFGAVR